MKRILSLLLALAVFCPLSGCRRSGNGDGPASPSSGPTVVGAEKQTVRSGILTGVYAPETVVLPEGYAAGYATSGCTPRVDRETGRFSVLLTRTGDDTAAPYLLVTADPSHGVTDSVPLDLPPEEDVRKWGFDAEGTLFFVTAESTADTGTDFRAAHIWRLYRFDPAAEKLSDPLVLDGFFSGSSYEILNFAVDAEGMIWVGDLNGDVSVFTPELTFDRPVNAGIRNAPITPNPAGGVALKLNSAAAGALFVDREGGETRVELPELPDRIVFGERGIGPAEENRTFWYSSNSGVWRAVLDEKNNVSAELLMDYKNSDVKASVNGSSEEYSVLLAVLSEDCMLFFEHNGLCLYRSAGDIDLSAVRTLEIAVGTSFRSGGFDWNDLFTDYNRNHPDCRVILKDYTLFNTAENPEGGVDRLTMELVTGLYKPDLVIGAYGGDLMRVIVRDRLYADLAPFIDTDDTVNRDNLFDCAERMFDDGEGGIWGLSNGVNLRGPLTSAAMLERYAPDVTETEGWDLGRMLDFAESLPRDVEFYYNLTQENADTLLLGPDAYSVFVDTAAGEAHFDSPLFLRWLNFLAALPKDAEALAKVSPTGRLNRERNWAGIYDYLYRDKVALNWGFCHYIHNAEDLEAAFGTKDWAFVGHPAQGHSGIDTEAEETVVITASCADRELAWDVLKTLLTQSECVFVLPVLETKYDELLRPPHQEPGKHMEIHYFDHETIGGPYDPENPITEADLKKPGYIVIPRWEDFDHVKDVLRFAGYPMREKLSPDLLSIVREEISAFLAGHGTAADCAGKIQSRTGLWLAERQ